MFLVSRCFRRSLVVFVLPLHRHAIYLPQPASQIDLAAAFAAKGHGLRKGGGELFFADRAADGGHAPPRYFFLSGLAGAAGLVSAAGLLSADLDSLLVSEVLESEDAAAGSLEVLSAAADFL